MSTENDENFKSKATAIIIVSTIIFFIFLIIMGSDINNARNNKTGILVEDPVTSTLISIGILVIDLVIASITFSIMP